MNDFMNDYRPDENYNGPRLEPGDHPLKIKNILFGNSKSTRLPMMTVELIVPSAPSITFNHYIPKNEYFNQNMTKFFDCFGIPRGNNQYEHWLERMGKGHIDKGEPKDNGKAYLELKYLIVEKKTGPNPQNQPAQHQAAPRSIPAYQQPAQQPAQVGQNGIEPFTDEVPWSTF